MPVNRPARTTLVEIGTRVIIPDTSSLTIGVVTTEPNWQHRVRVDWDEGRTHHFRFISPEALHEPALASVSPSEPEEWASPHLELVEAPEPAEAFVSPYMDLS
jgi:hypothetical protein